MLAIENDGRILFSNAAFAEMMGYEPEEVLSLRFHQIFHQAPASESPTCRPSMLWRIWSSNWLTRTARSCEH